MPQEGVSGNTLRTHDAVAGHLGSRGCSIFLLVFIFPAARQEAAALPQPKGSRCGRWSSRLCNSKNTPNPKTGGFGPKRLWLAGGGCRIGGWFVGVQNQIPDSHGGAGVGPAVGHRHPAASRPPGHRGRCQPGVGSRCCRDPQRLRLRYRLTPGCSPGAPGMGDSRSGADSCLVSTSR